jgi:hypothetical protein
VERTTAVEALKPFIDKRVRLPKRFRQTSNDLGVKPERECSGNDTIVNRESDCGKILACRLMWVQIS